MAGSYHQTTTALQADANAYAGDHAFLSFSKNPKRDSAAFAQLVDQVPSKRLVDGTSFIRAFQTPPILDKLCYCVASPFVEMLSYATNKKFTVALGIDDYQIALRGKMARLLGLQRRYVKLKRARDGLPFDGIATECLRLPVGLLLRTRDKSEQGIKYPEQIMKHLKEEIAPHVKFQRLLFSLDREYASLAPALEEEGAFFIRTSLGSSRRNFQFAFGEGDLVEKAVARGVRSVSKAGVSMALFAKTVKDDMVHAVFRQSNTSKSKGENRLVYLASNKPELGSCQPLANHVIQLRLRKLWIRSSGKAGERLLRMCLRRPTRCPR